MLGLGVVVVLLKNCAEAAGNASPGAIAGWSIFGILAIVGGLSLRSRWARQAAEQEAETERRFAEQQAAAQQWRFQQLAGRFGEEAARGIMERRVWQGATRDMILEAFGPPATVDEKVFKTKTSHTLKYNQIAANRFAFKVFLENDVVVGWEGQA